MFYQFSIVLNFHDKGWFILPGKKYRNHRRRANKPGNVPNRTY